MWKFAFTRFIRAFYIEDILCIDVENQTTKVNENLINLNDLSQTLKIGEQTVLLIRVIGFEKPIDNKILKMKKKWTTIQS